MTKIQETINTAKLSIEHVKIEEHKIQKTQLNTKQNLLAVYTQLKSCNAENFKKLMGKLANKENDCEHINKNYKQLADKAN